MPNLAPAAPSDAFASLHHEMRAPLASIVSYADAVHQRALGPDAEAAYRDYIRSVAITARHLLAVADVHLALRGNDASAKAASETKERIADLFQIALDIVRPHADRRRIQIDVSVDETDVSVQVNRQFLIQILVNLLTNAINHGPADARILLDARLGQSGLQIRVTDEGNGLTLDEIRTALSRYGQLCSRQDSPGSEPGSGGVGLGLPLVKAMVEWHEGRFLFTRVGGALGMRAIVTLPTHRIQRDLAETSSPIDHRSGQSSDQRQLTFAFVRPFDV